MARVPQRPTMSASGDLRDLTAEAWAHIETWSSTTDPRRFVARYGTALVQLDDDDGRLVTQMLDRRRMLSILSRAVRWTTKEDKATFPPHQVADNLLVTVNPPVPRLERIVEVPILDTNGNVHDRAGYDSVTRCFLAPANGLSVPPVATRPTAADVCRARELVQELVCDFPFRGLAADDNGDHERAHAYSVFLHPFVRNLIDGNTPLHLFEAPTPGTGKTLAAMALATPALGARPLPAMPEAHGDEWRKRLTAALRSAPEYLLLDNLRHILDSAALALVLTTGVMKDRLLGVSDVIVLPVRCCWVATGNNIGLSDEMTRRSVRIRQDAGVEFPEQRAGFRHPHLLRWVREQRGDLVWAALTLGRSWVAAGRPDPNPPQWLGGFEAWTHVVGGILEHADLGQVLGNVDELRAVNRDAGPGAFLDATWLRFGPGEWTAHAAIDLGQEYLDIGAGPDAQLAHLLGNRLRMLIDRPLNGYVLRRPGRTQSNTARYAIAKAQTEET